MARARWAKLAKHPLVLAAVGGACTLIAGLGAALIGEDDESESAARREATPTPTPTPTVQRGTAPKLFIVSVTFATGPDNELVSVEGQAVDLPLEDSVYAVAKPRQDEPAAADDGGVWYASPTTKPKSDGTWSTEIVIKQPAPHPITVHAVHLKESAKDYTEAKLVSQLTDGGPDAPVVGGSSPPVFACSGLETDPLDRAYCAAQPDPCLSPELDSVARAICRLRRQTADSDSTP